MGFFNNMFRGERPTINVDGKTGSWGSGHDISLNLLHDKQSKWLLDGDFVPIKENPILEEYMEFVNSLFSKATVINASVYDRSSECTEEDEQAGFAEDFDLAAMKVKLSYAVIYDVPYKEVEYKFMSLINN